MDKETLSNYGWIVICVLVLAVMIALAGPFGNFISDAVKSTTQGLFDVNQNALDSAGIAIDDQILNDKSSKDSITELSLEVNTFGFLYGHTYICTNQDISAVFYEDTSAVIIQNGETTTIPQGVISYKTGHIDLSALGAGMVTVNSNGLVLQSDIGDFTLSITHGDYEYRYAQVYEGFTDSDGTPTNEWFSALGMINGWGVRVSDYTKTSYSTPLSVINNVPVSIFNHTYFCCDNLLVAPLIPETATMMIGTFSYCHSLKTVESIPKNAQYIESLFHACNQLEGNIKINIVNIPANYSGCFYGTQKPITLVGENVDVLTKLAETADNGNVTI